MPRTFMLGLISALVLAGCGVPQHSLLASNPKGTAALPQSAYGPGTPGYTVAPSNAPSGPVVDQFAANFLNGVQARSFAGQREYCGYFYVDNQGRLRGTPPRAGTFASCDLSEPQVGQGIIASYHTHGAFGRDYDNEVPSVIDLESDFDYGIDGYIATPGGRVWHVDYQTLSTQQLCGLRCISSDPRFLPVGEAGIKQVYTVQSLQDRFARF